MPDGLGRQKHAGVVQPLHVPQVPLGAGEGAGLGERGAGAGDGDGLAGEGAGAAGDGEGAAGEGDGLAGAGDGAAGEGAGTAGEGEGATGEGGGAPGDPAARMVMSARLLKNSAWGCAPVTLHQPGLLPTYPLVPAHEAVTWGGGMPCVVGGR